MAEFFAVAYEDYLCDLYTLPSAREAGFEHLEPVFAFIDRRRRGSGSGAGDRGPGRRTASNRAAMRGARAAGPLVTMPPKPVRLFRRSAIEFAVVVEDLDT